MLVICLCDALNGYQIHRLCIFFSVFVFLTIKTFKIVRSVLRVDIEEKYFIKYFLGDRSF